MKRFLILPAVLLTLGLGGCGAGSNVGQFVDVATRTITNPVTEIHLHQAKVAFAGSQEAVIKYQRDCFGSQLPPYPVTVARIRADSTLSVQCKRRVSRYNAMKAAEGKAYNAIVVAGSFIVLNPTGNAATYMAAMWRAVNDYRAKAGG